MVSRREKLKLSQSKAQEQIFNLHVKLINQELSAGNTRPSTALHKCDVVRRFSHCWQSSVMVSLIERVSYEEHGRAMLNSCPGKAHQY